MIHIKPDLCYTYLTLCLAQKDCVFTLADHVKLHLQRDSQVGKHRSRFSHTPRTLHDVFRFSGGDRQGVHLSTDLWFVNANREVDSSP